ncbi:hypothetical protein PACILC2_23300 [Paenibacillus cisolokensis]|jgi:hypothetical protein|uniref:Uncharacterized protein n=1 Tax=Paenibacillus cisolokensis TaxID=1658519 RepID=A0ABQ4N6J1_9BACL|nr:hypothetical protein [Paenibacillus cisolokensis]GIQ63762.1 hypothetical protein PACILC2_23300 [Paenibacillus cisolokensis]
MMEANSSTALLFQFSDAASAAAACDTMIELGYDSMLAEDARLHLHLERDDVVSALEIAQAHGGRLIETPPLLESSLADGVYAMDQVPIPAHIVNEDWTEAYASGDEPADETRDGTELPFNGFPVEENG